MKKFLVSAILCLCVIKLAYCTPRNTINANSANFDDLKAINGIVQSHETFIDLASSDTDYYRTWEKVLSSASFVSGGTTWLLADTAYSNSAHPRNVVVRAAFQYGESTTTVVGLCTTVGSNARGITTTETISFSTNSATGNVAWQSITSFSLTGTVSGAGQANIGFQVGTSSAIGLANNIDATGDVQKVIEAGSLTSPALNATYDTVIFVTAPNATIDHEIYYYTISR